MRTRIVAVDGHGGSGKSSFARHLSRELGDAPIVQTDDFASWDKPIDWWPQLLDQVLIPISRGEIARYERSRWGGETEIESVTVAPAEFLILEGVTASREEFSPYLTYSIWVEARADIRLDRGLKRDGPDTFPQWRAWMEEEDRYREAQRPDERADLVVRGDCDLWT